MSRWPEASTMPCWSASSANCSISGSIPISRNWRIISRTRKSWRAALDEHRAIRDAIAARDPRPPARPCASIWRVRRNALPKISGPEAASLPRCADRERLKIVADNSNGSAKRPDRLSKKTRCNNGGRFMLKKLTTILAMSAAAFVAATSAGLAQTKLKWAHVYETSEPFHTGSVWAAQEIEKRTNGRYADRRLSGLAARQGSRHQPGPDAGHASTSSSPARASRPRATRRSA